MQLESLRSADEREALTEVRESAAEAGALAEQRSKEAAEFEVMVNALQASQASTIPSSGPGPEADLDPESSPGSDSDLAMP